MGSPGGRCPLRLFDSGRWFFRRSVARGNAEDRSEPFRGTGRLSAVLRAALPPGVLKRAGWRQWRPGVGIEDPLLGPGVTAGVHQTFSKTLERNSNAKFLIFSELRDPDQDSKWHR